MVYRNLLDWESLTKIQGEQRIPGARVGVDAVVVRLELVMHDPRVPTGRPSRTSMVYPLPGSESSLTSTTNAWEAGPSTTMTRESLNHGRFLPIRPARYPLPARLPLTIERVGRPHGRIQGEIFGLLQPEDDREGTSNRSPQKVVVEAGLGLEIKSGIVE